MNFPKTLIIWLVIIGGIVWLFPQTLSLKLSNLLYRRGQGDVRQAVDTTTAPWNAVGRLQLPNAICTATLVAPNVIVSARHCFGKANKIIPADKITFQLERDGKLENISKLKKIFYPDVGFLTSQTNNIKNDFAFALLSDPVDIKKFKVTFPAIASVSPAVNQPLAQAGYGANKEKLYGDRCTTIAVTGELIIQHNCLITFGDSGGPIFYQQNNQWFLAGVNSFLAEMQLTQNAFAIGPENYYAALQKFMAQ